MEKDCGVCGASSEYMYRLEEVERDVKRHQEQVTQQMEDICGRFEKMMEKQNQDFTCKIGEVKTIMDKTFWTAVSLLVSVILLMLGLLTGKLWG